MNRVIKPLVGALTVLFVFSGLSFAQEQVATSMIEGKVVVLYDDKTWDFADSADVISSGCEQLFPKVEFCPEPQFWSKTTPTGPEISAMYFHGSRDAAMFVIEAIGRADGLTFETLIEIALENASNATGVPVEKIPVLRTEATTLSNKQAETVVYFVSINELNFVFANTVFVAENLSMQAITYSVGTEYTPEHQKMHAGLVADIRVAEDD